MDAADLPGSDPTGSDSESQPASDAAEHGEDSVTVTLFSSLEEWLQDWFLHTWQHRRVQSQTWCRQWWAHPEAISRLEAMWRAWEAARVQDGPAGMATWWRDVADYHMSQLLDNDGPFHACRDGHRDDTGLGLTAEPAPAGWFTDWDDHAD